MLDAIEFYNTRDYDKASRAVEKAIEDDKFFVEAFLLQGDINTDKRLPEKAIESYKKALYIAPDFSPGIYFTVANLELSTGRYGDARKDYLKFLDYRDIPPQKKERSLANLRSCDFALDAIGAPVPFAPFNLGDSINSPYDEYVNAVTADGGKLYFTRAEPKDAQTIDQDNLFEEEFFLASSHDTSWYKALNLGPPVNTNGNEGAVTISPDGQKIFFAACNREDGYGSCDLYMSHRSGDRWLEPQNLGPVVNSGAWDSQPSFSSDGKTLYFASKRGGGKGSSDIWKTEMQADGTWSLPVNLGDSINTKDTEMAPFIHPDDQTLYFSSKGHLGMGNLDLFFARKDAAGKWRKPSNLGYPINTYADEITLVVNATGTLAYISSAKLGGKGGQDIYAFRLYEGAQPLKVNYFKGIVYDKETKQRLSAKFDLTDIESGKTIVEANSDPVNGEFLLALPTRKNYALNVSKPGYLFYSEHFELTGEGTKAKPITKDIPLQVIRQGETVVLKNIFFDTDKFDLKPESQVELAKLVSLLKSNPKIKIEIGGHTDNEGKADHNLTLSQNRAKAVYDFLVQTGIPSQRLTYVGFGMTKPIDTNETPEGRANNRRTEFKVTAF
jgi:outer membrane protein OmpA-like peptidoglycan-associated protein